MPRIVDKQKKNEDISRAALRVFRELGYHKSRMADVARAAGVGKGTLYEYFENKGDLLRFAFDFYFKSFKTGAMEAVALADDPAAKLLALVTFALEHAAEWEDHCVVYVDYLGVERTSQRAISLGGMYAEMRDLLAELIEQGQAAGTVRPDIDANGTAQALLAVYDGIILHRVFEEGDCDMTSVRLATLAMIAQGLRPSPGWELRPGLEEDGRTPLPREVSR